MRKTTLLLLALLLSTSAYGGHYADTYVIPIVGHVTGVNGTMWMSDVAIRNFQTTPLEVQLIVVESGFNPVDNIFPLTTATVMGSITVPPSHTLLLRDVLNGHRGMDNVTGALILGADAPFAVTSRSYNNSTMQVGQTVPAARDFLENTFEGADNDAFAYVPGIINNARARTNVGFVAGAGPNGPLTVEITIRGGNGGSLGTRSITVPAGQFVQLQLPLSQITTNTAAASLDVGSIDFRISTGEGIVVPYASVIDNATGAATFIMGQFPETTAMTSAPSRSLLRRLMESSF